MINPDFSLQARQTPAKNGRHARQIVGRESKDRLLHETGNVVAPCRRSRSRLAWYGMPANAQVPLLESLRQTVERVLPCWADAIAPAIRAGKRVSVNAHGNSLRALMKYLDVISDNDIASLDIPNGVPIAYQLDKHLVPISHRFLAGALYSIVSETVL